MWDKGEKAASAALCAAETSEWLWGLSQVHRELVANKNLGMARKSSPLPGEDSGIRV